MKHFAVSSPQLSDTAAESVVNRSAEYAALESHLRALEERFTELSRIGAAAKELADIKLQTARAMVGLERGAEAWAPARDSFDVFIEHEDWESAADACDVLYKAAQPQSMNALGQGIWLAVTYPVDPELTLELLNHIVEETPDAADGAAVAATTALFLSDIRAEGKQREDLMFFAGQILGNVARRHGEVDSQQAFDLWMQRLELRDPPKFLGRLRTIVDVLVQDDWWFDREALQAKLPVN